MTSGSGIRPVMDPHYHYDHTSSTSPYHHSQPHYEAAAMHPAYVYENVHHLSPMRDEQFRANMARRLSTPQMGYYDLITGEYRYRSADQQYNQALHGNYAGETEPPMCENSCKCCQVKVPFNCLTICFITSLMLLLMFTLFKLLLDAKPKESVNMGLFQDMIWLMAFLALLFFVLIILKYTCFKHSRSPCLRCKLLEVLADFQHRDRQGKFCGHSEHNPYAESGEEFV